MKTEKNIFGGGILYEEDDLKGTVYALCCACVSIYSEFLSWASFNKERIVKTPEEADSIIILSCQVTDLSILNDLEKAENLIKKYPEKDYYIGGCLAKRFDVDMPKGINRLDNIKKDYQQIVNANLINFDKPFWVPDFKDEDDDFSDGHLFRNMYPLRISVGCSHHCAYCTIKTIRGLPYELETCKLKDEFLSHENVFLTADSPSIGQLEEWCILAKKHNKQISIRNIEPHVACAISSSLIQLAEKGLLKIFHCPVQSVNKETLENMGRSWEKTFAAIELMRTLKAKGVFTATNIIVDYKDFPNTSLPTDVFDYVSWNPYWNGLWNRGRSEERFKKYINV